MTSEFDCSLVREAVSLGHSFNERVSEIQGCILEVADPV